MCLLCYKQKHNGHSFTSIGSLLKECEGKEQVANEAVQATTKEMKEAKTAFKTRFASLRQQMLMLFDEAEAAADRQMEAAESALKEEVADYGRRSQGPKYDLGGEASKSIEEVKSYLSSKNKPLDPKAVVETARCLAECVK